MVVVEQSPVTSRSLTRYDFWEICSTLFLSFVLFSLSPIFCVFATDGGGGTRVHFNLQK